MAKFTMTLDIKIHDHSPTAHRHFISAMLDQVKQAVGGGIATEGEIVTPAAGTQARAVVGSWEMQDSI
jgi:hypothetical protein